MDVTPQELRSSEIKDSWRGYDRDEVDDLLERAAITIESLTQELQESQSRPAPVATASGAPVAAPTPAEVPLPSSRDDAEMLQRTLLMAQRAADDAVNDAQARAKQMLEESEAKAQTLVSDAEATARRIAEGERRRLESELLELSARREQLRADADALEHYVAAYRDRIRAAIEGDLAQLGGDVEPPSERPELHDVEVPIEREPAPTAPVAAVADATPDVDPTPAREGAASGGGTSNWDDGPATRAISGLDAGADTGPFAAEPSSGPSPVAAPPRPEPAEWPPPAPSAAAPAPASAPTSGPAPTAESSWLSSAEPDWASAPAWDAPAPWERDGAPAGAPSEPYVTPDAYASEVPMEANPVDTDSLDDDAFFASLREAVRDDAPLGPRDEEQATFFEAGAAEQDRRRFRRRR
jgi:DivIVA domain-containing protein